jgi:chorismate mutase
MTQVHGVRGATVAINDQPDEILSATRELLQALLDANPEIETTDIASVWFTVTHDLFSVHPARAARQMGWTQVPLMCSQEIPVPGALQRCIRILLHWNTNLPQSAIRHVYLREAISLRPDLNMTDFSTQEE